MSHLILSDFGLVLHFVLVVIASHQWRRDQL